MIAVTQDPLQTHQVYVGLVALLTEMGVQGAEDAVACSKALAEAPPTFIVHVGDGAQEILAGVLSVVLNRKVEPAARCSLDLYDAHRVAQFRVFQR